MPGYEIFDEAEREQIKQVMDTGVLMRFGFDAQRNGVNKTLELEACISKTFGVKHCQLTTSGTTALVAALTAAGVGAGDEVILPVFTFVASWEAVLSVGAVPVLVNIDDTLTMSPKSAEEAISPRTKVIMPVHMCGAQADVNKLLEICEKHNITLIEDACQASGATIGGKYLGSFGLMGCFSFDYVKTVTMGEGGCVITDSDGIAEKLDGFCDHGHDHKGKDRGADLHPFIGTNFRVSELSSAIGIAQFAKLEKILKIQRENKKYIKNALKKAFSQLSFRRILDEAGDNASFLSFSLDSLERARAAAKALADAAVGGFHYYDNNWHYLRSWQHLKELKTLNPLSKVQEDGVTNMLRRDFSTSDDIMGRNISCAINLGWSRPELEERTQKMIKAIASVY